VRTLARACRSPIVPHAFEIWIIQRGVGESRGSGTYAETLTVCLMKMAVGSTSFCPFAFMRASSSCRFISISTEMGNRSMTAFTGFGTIASSFHEDSGSSGAGTVQHSTESTSGSRPYTSWKVAEDAVRPACMDHWRTNSIRSSSRECYTPAHTDERT
jgi:hypothetical protein